MGELSSIVDPAGRRVVLDEKGWAHIVRRHPQLSDLRATVMFAVAEPDFVTPDQGEARQHFWRHSVAWIRWLRVVVDFGASPALVVAALPARNGPREWPTGLIL